MVLPQATAWVQYWFCVLSLKFCGKSKKNCGDISQVSPAFCMYGYHLSTRSLNWCWCLCWSKSWCWYWCGDKKEKETCFLPSRVSTKVDLPTFGKPIIPTVNTFPSETGGGLLLCWGTLSTETTARCPNKVSFRMCWFGCVGATSNIKSIWKCHSDMIKRSD